MRKPVRKSSNKMRKTNFEDRFAQMVAEYNAEKEVLETMEQGTDEYNKQQKLCDSLFAKAERFINSQK